MNIIMPSKKASYNCEGCLGKLSIVGYIIANGNSVTLPINSTLIKLAILPKNNPIGATVETKSESKKKSKLFFLVNKKIENTIPIKPPWNDMPPFQI